MQRNASRGLPEAEKLRELAAWYREFAMRAGSTVIWETRLRMADDLDHAADQLIHEWIERNPFLIGTVLGTSCNLLRSLAVLTSSRLSLRCSV